MRLTHLRRRNQKIRLMRVRKVIRFEGIFASRSRIQFDSRLSQRAYPSGYALFFTLMGAY